MWFYSWYFPMSFPNFSAVLFLKNSFGWLVLILPEYLMTNANIWFSHIFELLDHLNVIETYFLEKYIGRYWYIFFLFPENQEILKLTFDYQLSALIYFTAEGNGTRLIGIDDATSGVQAFGLLNSNDLPYGPLQITGIALDVCDK